MKRTLLLLLMTISVLSVHAYDFDVDGIYYNKLSENTVEVTYKESETGVLLHGSLLIPIGNGSYVNSVTVPNVVTYNDKYYSVVAIGDGAFANSDGLVSITIPDSVKSIGKCAFYDCGGITSIAISRGITSVECCAFSGCEGLTSIIIPDGVTSIEESTFSGCSGLASITIPDRVTSIGRGAFENCSGLASITIPDRVTSIGHDAFKNCSGLTSITIPDGVTSIEDRVFYGCKKLITINIPDGVTSIGDEAFSRCYGLASINIPDGVTSIGDEAFYGCEKLISMSFSNGITSIGDKTFYGCKILTSIIFPNAVTSASIGKQTFSNCSKLENVILSNINQWIKITSETNRSGLWNYNLIVNGLKLTDMIVPEDVVAIGKYTFYGCNSLESVIFHKNVTAIAQNAFNGCKNVKKIICQGDTPPACGAKALDGISRTECTLYVPETSGSNYQNTAPWSEFTNIVGGGTETPDTPGTCETPTITFDNTTKQLKFASATDGAQYHYTVSSEDMATDGQSGDGVAQMTGVYTVTAYASAEGMYNSEKVTAKLLWVNAVIDASATDVVSAKTQRGVIVSTSGGCISVSGTVGGETIEVYNAAGSLVKSVKATDGNTVIDGLADGNVYIVKIGGTSVKIVVDY